jgi:hypothetical protein
LDSRTHDLTKSVSLSVLADSKARQEFFTVMEWALDETNKIWRGQVVPPGRRLPK